MSVAIQNNDTTVATVGNNHSDQNRCVLPQLQTNRDHVNGSKAIRLKAENEFLPQDLILALRQSNCPQEYLGPPSKFNGTLRPTVPSLTRRPDNVWNHAKQREKFRFLLDQNTCTCGAGRDISFLYDAVSMGGEKQPISQTNRSIDKSAIRAQTELQQDVILPESIIPQEFRIVKNLGVVPVEVYDGKHTTVIEDHVKHITVFPSLKPVGRNEVMKLRHTMDALLQRITIENNDERGQTQLHNLLELIKEEQNIYNIIFHEIIRQVSIECKERGELLSKLRERYSTLLSRVPRQIKSLHEELIAQRALDRRLAEQLLTFKSTVGNLMLELEDVREHDKRVSEEAEIAQKDLETALTESQKNASLLTEYHDLYDLQRKRLEKQIGSISSEKELWRDAAHTIALKVIGEHELNTSKRISISEKSWSKLANHFAIYLTDKDTIDLTELQKQANYWREIIESFDKEQMLREDDSIKNLNRVLKSIELTYKAFQQTHFDSEGKLINVPDRPKVIEYLAHTKHWEESMNREIEKFGGDSVLINEERIKKADRYIKKWIELADRLLSRHPLAHDKESNEQKALKELFDNINLLHKQYRIRMTGENGVAQSVIFFNNALELWNQKLSTYSYSNGKISDTEWIQFYQQMEDWIESLTKTVDYVGKSVKDDEINANIVVGQTVLQQANKGLISLRHYIESQDGRILEEILVTDSSMVFWLIQILISLAPDQKHLSKEAKHHLKCSQEPVEKLISNEKTICEQLLTLTKYIVSCCAALAAEEMFTKQMHQETNAEKEVIDLKRLQDECNDWVYSSKIILAELTGDSTHIDISQPKREIPLNEQGEPRTEQEEQQQRPISSDKSSRFATRKDVDDNLSFEAISRGGLTERRQLITVQRGATLRDEEDIDNQSEHGSSKSAKTGFDALKTINKLQQQLTESEARAASLEEKSMTLDISLKEAQNRVQQLEKQLEAKR